MALQYWVGDFFVDLSRNQVTQKQESQTIAPKALAVLTYLAENQKRVVSYDELFDNVWPNTVVTPNTLQRCIAQLRKVLSANDTTNSYIKTHAKQGYSLECDVRWQHESEVNTALHEPIKIAVKEDNITDDKSSESSSNITNNRISINSKTLVNYIFNVFSLKIFTLTILALTVITWILLGYPNSVFKNGSNSKPLVFDQLRSLTATDDKEYSAIYSPDGKYIVFHRYVDKLCKNNLWAKDLSTQQEFQLLDKIGTYGDHSFSPDGNKLAFIASQDCEQPVTQQRCYRLKSLNFNQSLTSPQSATLIVECKNSELKQPIWLDDENILMMQKKDKRWQLINYSLVKKQTVTLFSSNEEKILSFDYSKEQQLIAISTIHQNNQRLLKLLKPNGVLVSNHVIQFPQGFSKFKFIHPTFDDSNKQLVFSSVRELFTLSYEGIVTKVPLPLDSKIESPHFHPDGSRLLLIKMSYDSDIALLPLNTLANDSAMKAEDLVKSTRTIARSNVAEENALFNPQDNSIAFVSDRSGQDQLWITHNNQTKLVSSLPHNTLIRGIDWASDGQSVLVNASGTLTLLKLDNTDKKQKEIAFEHPVIQLFQWDNENNTALMNVNIKGVSGLIELNLTDLSYRHIATKKAVWAQKGIDGKIIYSDKRDRFWMFKPIENQLISPLVGKQVNVRFVLKDNVIYGVNKAKELLQYNINTQILSKLAQLDENIDYLTDINENQALFELTISGKKEVVELANQSSRL